MRILESRKLEDCFDGNAVYWYRFETPWTGESILALSSLGKLEYFADLPRPFFRLRTPRGMFAQGICGESTCRIILPREGNPDARRAWESLFSPGTPADRICE